MKGSVEHLTLFSLGCTNTHTHTRTCTYRHTQFSCKLCNMKCLLRVMYFDTGVREAAAAFVSLPLWCALPPRVRALVCVVCVTLKEDSHRFPPFVGLWLLSSEVQTGLLKCNSREGPLRLSDKWSLTLCGCEGAAGSSCGDAELRQMQGLRTKGTCAKGEISL